MLEFTGERVVPGQVNENLWFEHFARYAFARQFAAGRRVLDAGCGAGYGTAELALAASQVVGLDASEEAVEFASEAYPAFPVKFLAGSCVAMPFRNGSFDLVVSFEVIEHLKEPRAFIEECSRVLTSEGLLIVSSPNKLYYTESRGDSGPNPFHEHEFEPEEFHHELSRIFPQVMLLAQNQLECFAFHTPQPFWPAQARLDSTFGDLRAAQFLIALCSMQSEVRQQSFIYVPKAGNLLREREQHILSLTQARDERDRLLQMFRDQQQELEGRNHWAQQLNNELTAASARIVELQQELATTVAGYQAHVAELERNLETAVQWARSIEAEAAETQSQLQAALEAKSHDLTECIALLDRAEKTVVERTEWAQQLEAESTRLNAELNKVRASRWIKLGHRFGLGPAIRA